ncbi:MAG: hypothetical protein ACRDPC_07640 [Solirubrobacteraceae bacterium]
MAAVDVHLRLRDPRPGVVDAGVAAAAAVPRTLTIACEAGLVKPR